MVTDSHIPKTPLEALQRYFGYESFRHGQEEIIRSALSANDTLVVMPTGGGKSLCYQIPALLLPGVTIVVSPLIALMKDQVDALGRHGIRATTINSALDFSAVRQRMNDIRFGMYKMVYVAPERFESQGFLELMRETPISLFAIDEAHCISEWGHDFRPSYLRLRQALEELKNPPVIALTATATPYVQQDIITQLSLRDPKRYVRGFDRPNLRYRVQQSADKEGDLRTLAKLEMKREGASIIYCGTRKSVESVGSMLHAEGLPISIYHAGMQDDHRRIAQESFISGKTKIIIATNAFGMGIDKADVRHVFHYEMPGSIEAYYQEAGRAGRDGKTSECTLLYNAADRRLQEFFIRMAFPDRSDIEAVYTALWDSLHVAAGSRFEGVFVPDEKAVANRSRVHGALFNNILGTLEKNEVLRKVRADRLGFVQFKASGRDIQEYHDRTRDPERKKALMALLRTLGGAAISQGTFVNPLDISQKHGISPEDFERCMRAFMLAGLLRYTPPTPGTGYQFLHERMEPRLLRLDEKALEMGRNRALMKLDAVDRYIHATACRRDFILEYFCAEHETASCGQCDVCTSAPAKEVAGIRLRPQFARASEQLLAAVYELGGRFGKMTVVDLLRGSKNATITSFGLEDYRRFGELRDMERSELSRLADDLVDQRLLERTATLKPVLRITQAGTRSIRHMSLERFIFQRETEECMNPEILKRLQRERDSIARANRQRPELVCSDRILLRIANELPISRTAFLDVQGVNDEIYASCGSRLIAVIESITTEREWGEETPPGLPDRLRRTYMLLNDGCTLEAIAQRSALQPATISAHIEELLESGVDLNISALLTDGIIRAIRNELERKPRATLRELRALLGGSVEYPELRIALAWIRREEAKV